MGAGFTYYNCAAMRAWWLENCCHARLRAPTLLRYPLLATYFHECVLMLMSWKQRKVNQFLS